MTNSCFSNSLADLPALPVIMVAAAALVDTDGRVLLAERPEGRAMAGLWEFPGGKIEPGETPEQALIRELHEELGIETHASCLAPIGFASHRYDRFHLLMLVFACRQWDGIASAREGQRLAWAYPSEMYGYPMPAADLPLVGMLQALI